MTGGAFWCWGEGRKPKTSWWGLTLFTIETTILAWVMVGTDLVHYFYHDNGSGYFRCASLALALGPKTICCLRCVKFEVSSLLPEIHESFESNDPYMIHLCWICTFKFGIPKPTFICVKWLIHKSCVLNLRLSLWPLKFQFKQIWQLLQLLQIRW